MDSKLPCTWLSNGKPCPAQPTHPYHDKSGRVWANLCGIHSLTLDTALASPNPKLLLSAWVKASGGPKALSDSMKPSRDAAVKILSTFSEATKEPTGEVL
jgi:hypothetical protein